MEQGEENVVHKLRDQEIIKAFLTVEPGRSSVGAQGGTRLGGLSESLLSAHEAAWSLTDPTLDLPCVRTEDNEPTGYLDPATSNQPIHLNRTLVAWTLFIQKRMAELRRGDDGETIRILAPIVAQHRNQYGARETQAFVLRLWRHRWVIDANCCVNWLIAALADNPLELLRLAKDDQEGDRAFEIARTSIREAKETAATLDDWFEKLYLEQPILMYAKKFAEAGKSSDHRKRFRFLTEALVDNLAVHNRGILVFLGAQPHSKYYFANAPDAATPAAIGEAIQYFSYLHRARNSVPKFWFDEFADAARAGRPPDSILGGYTQQRLWSIHITTCPRLVLPLASGDGH